MLPDAPLIETRIHETTGEPIFRTTCPFCHEPREWAISWMAVWADFSRHYGERHRDAQSALKQAWKASLAGAR